jgi:uncharacterized protein YbcC (UPF0753/DUF2309 family)
VSDAEPSHQAAPLPPSEEAHEHEHAHADVTSPEDEVKARIEHFAHWLPEQRPLGVFVHLNPLGAFESRPFHAVCEAATRIRGARCTLTAERYRALRDNRRIRPEDIATAQKRLALTSRPTIERLPTPGAGAILLSSAAPELAVEASELVNAFLLRIMPSFLDLGSSIFPMPHRDEGLVGVLRRLSRLPFAVPEPWLGGLGKRLGTESSLALIVSCLEKRGPRETAWPTVIHEAMFALPGYAGMVNRLEHVPSERPAGVKVSLVDYVAARLVVEELALLEITKRLFGRKATLGTLAASLASIPTRPRRAEWSIDLAAFQDAYEEDYVRSVVGAIVMGQEVHRPSVEKPDVQMLCCIDDRLESIRRHIEEALPSWETFGSAGFFGVAIKHRAPLSTDETPSCPAPVTPEKRVTEVLPDTAAAALRAERRRARMIADYFGDDASRGPIGGVAASIANMVRAPRSLMTLLFPQWYVDAAHEFEGTRIEYDVAADPEGFTREQQAAVVRGNLANIGLLDGFARWVLVVAHGSMGTNNPFLSGYQCGACGGQRGGINARVFCAFANDKEVRALLAEKGVVIPEETRFLPGEHDTSLDIIRWFDVDQLPTERRKEVDALSAALVEPLEKNAKERSRRFADIPLEQPTHDVVARVRRRGVDFAETRPEYNHATNAGCVIGRRDLTRGIFLDRRIFLVSYDPRTDDAEHSTLQRLMAAPLPVCAGISLEYFFATMDPQRWGSGTKLPHNVQGLLGVSNGADGDLRAGLWTQTTEIHEPIRLVTLIDAEPEAITMVLERLPAVKHTVVNSWIHLFACSPSGRGFYRWVGQGFEPYDAQAHALFEVSTSLSACMHTRENVAPCFVVGDRAHHEAPVQEDA